MAGQAPQKDAMDVLQAWVNDYIARAHPRRGIGAHTAAYPPMNTSPPGFDPARDLPRGFFEFFTPLHHQFTPRQQQLIAARKQVLSRAHGGELPDYLPPSEATRGTWRIDLPTWC